MKIRNWKIKSDGFTMMEVLIGLAIFSIGILAMLGLQLSSIQGNDESREMNEAVLFASDLLEDLMLTPYTSVGDGSQIYTDQANKQYTVSWVVNENTVLNRKTINLNVGWSNRTDRVRMSHIIAEINSP